MFIAGCGTSSPKSASSSPSTSSTPSAAPSSSSTAAASSSGGGKSVTLAETGSSLLYPLFAKEWVPAYEKANSNVKLTSASTGSGTGIAQSLKGVVQIGASDAYLSSAQMKPGILNIPLAISAQIIGYNLPGLNNKHLNLSGPILAGIYTGKIKNWNDAAIKAANPGVSLPNHAIIPVRRNDSSGDSFLFTQYLSKSAPSDWSVAPGTSPSWPPVSSEASATGNGGMVNFLKGNPYSIAYVGISYENDITTDKLGYAALQNKAGKYVLPVRANIVAAAAAMVPSTPKDERISLIYAPGSKAYPIINYEYGIIQAKQSSPAVASALTAFLNWAISSSGGNQGKYLNVVHFLPLPSSTVKLDQAQISQIHG